MYVKAMLEDSLPSYSKVLWCSANSKSLSALYLNVPWREGRRDGMQRLKEHSKEEDMGVNSKRDAT